jgi:hypothetical protein
MSRFTTTFAALSRRLLDGSCARLLGAAQTYLRRTLKELVEEATEQLRKKAVSYVVAVALALVAAGALVAAIAAGLTALGMPPWASHLAVAAAAGAASGVCFARAKARKVIGTEDSDRAEGPSREFTIKIVNEVRAKPKPRKKRVRKTARIRAA